MTTGWRERFGRSAASQIHKVGDCECTCNDTYALAKLKTDLKSGKDKESPAMLSFVMKLGRCMRVCTPYYRVCAKQQRAP